VVDAAGEVAMSRNILEQVDDGLKEGLMLLPWDLELEDIAGARPQLAAVLNAMSAQAPEFPDIETSDHFAKSSDGEHDILVRLYRPKGVEGSLPTLFWIHGGGMVLGSVANDDVMAKVLTQSTQCAVASVEYRLAPEFPHPVPVTDCYDAMSWVFDNADELSLDKSRVAIGGASAGGGLAASLALLTRDRGVYEPCFQFLIYPMIDDRNENPSHHLVIPSKTWNREANFIGWRSLIGDGVGGDDVSPYAAAARAEDLSGLPPAYICVGTLDLFLDEDIDYAQRLNRAGVPCELVVYPGAFHGSEVFVPQAPLSQRMVADQLAALARALGKA